MSASSSEIALFRLEFGGTPVTLTDAYINGLFAIAEGIYGTEDRARVQTAAYLYHATSKRAEAIESVDYTANTASEKMSVVWERWNGLVVKYQADLDLLTKGLNVAQWGGLRKIPPPARRYPGDYQ